MQQYKDIIEQRFRILGEELVKEIIASGVVKEFGKGDEIIREGQFIRSVPVVLKGLLKVFSRYEDKELLLYYLEEEDSCIMSFTTSLNNDQSKVYAIAEEDSVVLLLPVEKVTEWIKVYPRMNDMFYRQYNQRYSELLDTIKHLLIDKMDVRLYDYLVQKANKKGECFLDLRHKDIALELGTAREVVSRMMKKLEGENKVRQHSKGIELINCQLHN